MKKLIIDNSCGICGHTESHEETVCDVCGTQLSQNSYIIKEIGNPFPIELIVGNTRYDFCNYRCLLDYILAELKKGN